MNNVNFDRLFGIFSEVQNGHSWGDAVIVAGRNLGENSDWYQPLFSRAASRVAERKKRSRYNGALVNGTFADATDANPAVMASVKNHPSFRYLVLSGVLAPEYRGLVTASLVGTLDSDLYRIYARALGREPGEGLEDSGDSGRVVLKFDTDAGVSTEVDLGGSLDTGYVVESVTDPLGIFPEGT
ncbi:MAG: hypothetical protein LBD78_04055, partial [Spirochaetaceae bacterium]|nr:hypothetical protein [Spirochaetaceae bacterium]